MLAQLKRVSKQGFTLLELLIVIAIIALLAVVIFFLLSPAEQLSKGRDAGRASTISQLGEAVEAYASSRSTSATPYPAEGAAWITTLVTAGEMGAVPGIITNTKTTASCASGQMQSTTDWCYDLTTVAPYYFVVFTKLEAKVNTTGVTPPCPYDRAFQVYSSIDSRSGRHCVAAVGNTPAPGVALTFY